MVEEYDSRIVNDLDVRRYREAGRWLRGQCEVDDLVSHGQSVKYEGTWSDQPEVSTIIFLYQLHPDLRPLPLARDSSLGEFRSFLPSIWPEPSNAKPRFLNRDRLPSTVLRRSLAVRHGSTGRNVYSPTAALSGSSNFEWEAAKGRRD